MLPDKIAVYFVFTMKIYTKTGDAGETSLFGGGRVSKDDFRIRTYGTLDELNAVLGMALTLVPDLKSELPGVQGGSEDLRSRLIRVQGELFQLGAELATPRGRDSGIVLIDDDNVEILEREIDGMEAELPPLKTFILPGGTALSAQLHLARTVARRAERELVVVHRAEPVRPPVLTYLNRLSDYLFVMARFANHQAGVADVAWISPRAKKV